MNIRAFCVAVLAACLGALPTYAQTPDAAPAQPAALAPVGPTEGASSAYVLGRDDVIEVGLLGRTDFAGRTRIQADGTIQLPLIGKIPVADRTTAEVSETVRKALQTGGFFSDPVVTVEVVGYASRYVTVLGAVGTPGLIPINRPYRISEILARVGGIREGGAEHLIVRSENGEERKLEVRDLAMGTPEQDPYVKAGDKIYAPKAETFYIYGQVNSPGAYPLTADSTVHMSIARAGGLTPSGSDKKVTVSRGGEKVKVDLDSKVQPGDVLEIGERLF
ncbi:MAG: polysaccharide biosynthesis/export family protein [Phenylobacterium sp.]|nr:polysaccharide biosynthesis/export family protein [Phenylobacterium sp.]